MTDSNNMSRLDKYLSGFAKSVPVAVLFGGRGHEHAVSLVSAEHFIREAQREGFPILPIFIDRQGGYNIFLWEKDALPPTLPGELLVPTYPVCIGGECGFLAEGKIVTVACAVPILHGDFGEDGVVQGALISAKIPLIGCDSVSGAVCADKAYTKWIAASLGIPTLSSVLINASGEVTRERVSEWCDIASQKLGYPMFVKPCRLGSSVGASEAMSRDELAAAIIAAAKVSFRIMIEPSLTDKRELECAYLSSGGRLTVTDPGEVDVGGEFYSYEEKYSSHSGARVISRARVESTVRETVVRYTAKLAAAIGISSFARFDYFLSGDGQIYFNEINTIPGMTEGSLYPKMLAECGIDFGLFVRLLLSGYAQ